MKKIIAYIIISLFVIEAYAGDHTLQFKVDFKELEKSTPCTSLVSDFYIETQTVITANTDEWCENLELKFTVSSFLRYNFFPFVNENQSLSSIVPPAVPMDTTITITEGISGITTSSSHGHLVLLRRPGVFMQAVRIFVELPPKSEWDENNIPEFFEINVLYAPVVFQSDQSLYLLYPSFKMIQFPVRLRKSGNINPVQTE